MKTPLPEGTIYTYVLELNRNHLDEPCMSYAGETVTYGQFFSRVRKIAGALLSHGLKKGDVITIVSIHVTEAMELVYAASYAGIIANMVYPITNPFWTP